MSEDGVLEGIITNRDIRYLSRTDYADIYVRDIMTPMPLVTGTPGLTKDEAFTLLSKNKIERLPLVDAAGKLAGLITLKDFVKTEQDPRRPQVVLEGPLLPVGCVQRGEAHP